MFWSRNLVKNVAKKKRAKNLTQKLTKNLTKNLAQKSPNKLANIFQTSAPNLEFGLLTGNQSTKDEMLNSFSYLLGLWTLR